MKNARGVPGRNVYINVNESSGWAGFVTLRADFGQVRRKNWPIWVPIFGRGQKLEVRADKFGLGLAGLLPLRPERRPRCGHQVVSVFLQQMAGGFPAWAPTGQHAELVNIVTCTAGQAVRLPNSANHCVFLRIASCPTPAILQRNVCSVCRLCSPDLPFT